MGKIILIAPAFPYRGGIAATTDRLAQEYVKRGEDVEIWTYKLLYPTIIFPGKSQYLEKGHASPEGVVIKRKINAINPFNWIKVGRQLKNLQPKMVMFRFWLPFFGPCLGTIAKKVRSNKTKTTCLVDNVIPHEKRIGDSTLSKYFFKHIDGFVVMSKEGIDQLKVQFNTSAKVKYSPHPIFDIYGEPLDKTSACQQLELDDTKHYILSFGLVRKYKGVDLLIEAFAKIHLDFPDHRLLIVGECYDDWSFYQQLIDQHNLNEKVIRAPKFVANEEVRYFFSVSDYLALTYRSATQSGVTQIAYSMNLPMLVTNVGDLANMVNHDVVGQVCESNVEAISTSMRVMDEEKLQHYRSNFAIEKEKFSWNRLCDNIDQLIA